MDELYATEKRAWRSKNFSPSASLVEKQSSSMGTEKVVEEKGVFESVTHV
jgi:hypothetical protein